MVIEIREIHDGEERVLLQLVRDVTADEAEGSDVGRILSLPDSVLLPMLRERLVLVAAEEGRPVGLVCCQELSGHDGEYAFVQLLAVASGYRRCGIGRRLVETLAGRLQSAGRAAYLVADVPAGAKVALRLLEQSGFRRSHLLHKSNTAYFTCRLHRALQPGCRWSSAWMCRFNYVQTWVRARVRERYKGSSSGFHTFFSRLKYRLRKARYAPAQRRTLERIRSRKKARVVFFASCIPMWKYQYLYDLLVEHPAFEPYIVLSPFVHFGRGQQQSDLEQLRAYFDARQVPYVNFQIDGPVFDVRRELDPDILFYPQPYLKCLTERHRFKHFLDRLLAYYPYGFPTHSGSWTFNSQFSNLAWRLFYSTDVYLQNARRFAFNKGANIEIVGYPGADDFRLSEVHDPWKPVPGRPKRIIWAPHFSINARLTSQSNFLWMADFMLWLAEEYAGRVQIAFKPHPRLRTELYKSEEWGPEKTDRYYARWASLPNGQVETGPFVDLFRTSDAMIHDSASFSVDYHYTRKPVMFVSRDIEEYRRVVLSRFGQQAVDLHYIGRDADEVRRFVDEVVLGGNDPMRPSREAFYRDCLLPPHGKTAAQNTLDCMLAALFG